MLISYTRKDNQNQCVVKHEGDLINACFVQIALSLKP